LHGENWISASTISGNQDISEDEIREHSWEKQRKEFEEFRRNYEKEKKKKEGRNWGW
jgi:hypothetical protein